jgi:PadR family transcriptional regulator, regulatory protein PadR
MGSLCLSGLFASNTGTCRKLRGRDAQKSLDTGLKSGTLYPILMRLAERRLLETRWESPEAGKPPRHMYKLTAAGLRYSREHAASSSKHSVGQPAFSGVNN